MNNYSIKQLSSLLKKIKKSENCAELSHELDENFSQNEIYKIKPFYVSYSIYTDCLDIRFNRIFCNWEKYNSLSYLSYYLNGKNSFKYNDVFVFYEDTDLISKKDELEEGEYIVFGIQNAKCKTLTERLRITKKSWTKTNLENLQDTLNKFDEDIHIFKLTDDVSKLLIKQLKEIFKIQLYQRERNCFELLSKKNNGKFKVHMDGDVIITDPCYVRRKRDESSRPKWSDYHPYQSIYEYPDYNVETKHSDMFYQNAQKMHDDDIKWEMEHPNDMEYWDDFKLSKFGITSYIIHNTLYGDWSCSTFNEESHECLGDFCADSGMVGVFLLNEVLKYNPDFEDYLTMNGVVTVIHDFHGDVWFEKLNKETLIVKGEGNINFFTKQTGF